MVRQLTQNELDTLTTLKGEIDALVIQRDAAQAQLNEIREDFENARSYIRSLGDIHLFDKETILNPESDPGDQITEWDQEVVRRTEFHQNFLVKYSIPQLDWVDYLAGAGKSDSQILGYLGDQFYIDHIHPVEQSLLTYNSDIITKNNEKEAIFELAYNE
jgi:hypothetical protein